MKAPSLVKENLPFLIGLIFVITLFFLSYLAFITQMLIVNDAIAFEDLAKTIVQKGWIEYFKTGPNREPFYVWLVTGSMHLANWWQLDYQDIQRFLQVFLLMATQALTYLILKKLKISLWLTAIVLLAIGFLPAMVDSTFGLYSEIAAYPFVLGFILASTKSFRIAVEGNSKNLKKLIFYSFLTGLCLIVVTFTKAIVEFVAILYFTAIGLVALSGFVQKKYSQTGRFLCFILAAFLTFFLPVQAFKSLNKKYNGNFAMTNRGPFMFYGNTSRHMDRLSFERVMVGITCAMGSGEQKICHTLFGQEACAFWDFRNSDDFARDRLNELSKQGVPLKETDKILTREAVKKILSNPFHYFPFYMGEALTVIFWKSAETTFVVYPGWVQKIYGFIPLQYLFNFLTSFFVLIAVFYLMFYIWKNRRVVFLLKESVPEDKALLFQIFCFIIPFIGLHALISVQTRYCLPIASLYLILIAFTIQSISRRS